MKGGIVVNLKNVMRYDAFLRDKIMELEHLTYEYADITTITHTYVGGTRESMIVDKSKPFDFTTHNLVCFLLYLADTRREIAAIINKYKANLDLLVSTNIIIGNTVSHLNLLLGTKTKTNVEGVGITWGTNVAGDATQLRHQTFTTSILAFEPKFLKVMNTILPTLN
jgi:hypothetical protein